MSLNQGSLGSIALNIVFSVTYYRFGITQHYHYVLSISFSLCQQRLNWLIGHYRHHNII